MVGPPTAQSQYDSPSVMIVEPLPVRCCGGFHCDHDPNCVMVHCSRMSSGLGGRPDGLRARYTVTRSGCESSGTYHMATQMSLRVPEAVASNAMACSTPYWAGTFSPATVQPSPPVVVPAIVSGPEVVVDGDRARAGEPTMGDEGNTTTMRNKLPVNPENAHVK